MKSVKTADLVVIALFSALIAVFSQLSIPTPFGIPLTLQTFIIAFSGFVLGSVKGATSVLVYVAAGAVGLPVFTGFQGGFASLFGMTGGFIFGFTPFVFLCGIRAKSFMKKHLCAAAGLLICHFFGILWYSLYSGNVVNAFLTISAPYFIKDVFCIVIALPLSAKIKVIIPKIN